MGESNFYKILEVSTSATQDQIRLAYIDLASKYHPDRNPGNKEALEKFTRIAEAYRVLSNPDSRYAYDLEIGITPEKEEVIPVTRRIEASPVTGSRAGDYLEEIAGGIPLPRLVKGKGDLYRLIGLDNPQMDTAYRKGLFSIGTLETSGRHDFFEKGIALFQQQEYEQAAAYFEELVFFDSRNILTRFLLGCCYEGLKQPFDAITQYKTALNIASKRKLFCLPIRETLIILYLRINRFDDVERECRLIKSYGLASTIADQALSTIGKISREHE